MEDELSTLLQHGWTRAERQDEGYDLQNLSAEGGIQVMEIKRFSGGTRDFHAALMQLAMVLADKPDVVRGYLVAEMPRMSNERAELEWKRVQSVLRPALAKRLALIAVGRDTTTVLPADNQAQGLAALVQEALQQSKGPRQGRSERRLSAKFFEVWKILLGAWLGKEGPIQIGEIATRAGCSYPTVAKALEFLHDRQEIERDSSRSVSFRAFPRSTLREVLVLQESFRQPIRFVDATGRRPDLESLLRRLEMKKPAGVALGGVLAARHYDPHFDLNGLPRIDLVMHAPVDLSWVRDVDPALRQTTENDLSPALVVRALYRPQPRFLDTKKYKLPIADAVETLLDLHDLRLSQQADYLVQTLRGAERKA